MGRSTYIVILCALILPYLTECREKMQFHTRAIGSKVYIGTNKLVTDHDGGFNPILREVDTKVVVYLDQFDLIDVKDGHVHVMDSNGKNSTITGTQITFLKLFGADYKTVLTVASEAQYTYMWYKSTYEMTSHEWAGNPPR